MDEPFVMTVNRENTTILGLNDFLYLVEKHMGTEAVKYIGRTLENAAETVKEAEAGLNTDLLSYESSIESLTRALQDIEEEVENVENLLEAKRINRDKIHESIMKIHRRISQEI
jgi:hypothetical protein